MNTNERDEGSKYVPWAIISEREKNEDDDDVMMTSASAGIFFTEFECFVKACEQNIMLRIFINLFKLYFQKRRCGFIFHNGLKTKIKT